MEKQTKNNPNYFLDKKEKTEKLYSTQKSCVCPYFDSNIIFNTDGFHHLRYNSSRKERSKQEQLLKFSLLPLAIKIIKKSGTIQEYRKNLIVIGKQSRDGFSKTKEVEYWGLVAIMSESKIKIKVILKRVGTGNIIFWSVMPYSKLKKGQKLYIDGIEDD